MTAGNVRLRAAAAGRTACAAAKWPGLAKYNFIGGNNDPEQVPVDGLIAAVSAVLRREGRTLATYGLAAVRRATGRFA